MLCMKVSAVIADAPRNIQLLSRQIYHPGDIIKCSADGNPKPSYQWKDLVSGTITEGDVLVISEEMVNNNYTFQCTAYNQYRGVSSVFNFTVGGKYLSVGLCCLSFRYIHGFGIVGFIFVIFTFKYQCL